jgi:Holliday junction resolvase
MSAYQRTKGAAYEREVVNQIKDTLGIDVSRNLTQTRDSGADIVLERYVIECKRRAGISIYSWMEQAEESCNLGQRPIVICRADKEGSLVIMTLEDFLPLLGNELNLHEPKRESPRGQS